MYFSHYIKRYHPCIVYSNVIVIHKLHAVGGVFIFLKKVSSFHFLYFFLSGYYYFVFEKILFFHFISSYCTLRTRLEDGENKTLVGGNCFRFSPDGISTSIFPSNGSVGHRKKTKAMRWHITNGKLYEI